MRAGTVISIPDASSRASGKETIQPGLPGRWSVWSQADAGPGAHFLIPLDDTAKATGVRYATVRIVEPQGELPRILLLATQPADRMAQGPSGGGMSSQPVPRDLTRSAA